MEGLQRLPGAPARLMFPAATAQPPFEGLSREDRAQGFVTLNLIVQWDNWVKRRVEQVRFVSTSSVSRRHSVDFRLRKELFGRPHTTWDDREVHYAPLVLLHKQALSNFDLRDENGVTLPMVSRAKNARIGAATLAAWSQTLIHQRLLRDIRHGRRQAGAHTCKLPPIAAAHTEAHPLRPTSIRLPHRIEELYWRLCHSSYRDSSDGSGDGARSALLEVLAPPAESDRVLPWRWRRTVRDGEVVWTAPVGDPWLPVLNRFELFRQLASDLARLFVMYVPVEHRPEARRVIKFSYETGFQGPGVRFMRGIRAKARWLARFIRRLEDWAEGFGWDRAKARSEWLPPSTPVEGALGPLNLVQTLGRACGLVARGAVFDVLGVGLGGTFHLEFSAPEGTQIKRARISATLPSEEGSREGESDGKRKRSGGEEDEPPGDHVRRRARRYAANVERCHLYLNDCRQGTSGRALVALKPKSSTIIRGAFLASFSTFVLLFVLVVFPLSEALRVTDGAEDSTRSVVALLLLAPALLASYTARGSEHSMTTSMIFGLRCLAVVVVICAVVAAALAAAGLTPDSHRGWWLGLLAVTGIISLSFAAAWRLAARAWPHRDEL